MGKRQCITQKGLRAIDARNSQLEMAQVLQKPVFVLPGCQRRIHRIALMFTIHYLDFTGEWFINHSNHIHIFTPITRIVVTKN